MKLDLLDPAKADLKACVRYYNARPSKYGRAIRAAFLRAVAAIESNPRLYSLVEDELPGFEMREYFIENFQQRVIYHVGDKLIRVVAIVHASSRGGSWHRRLDAT